MRTNELMIGCLVMTKEDEVFPVCDISDVDPFVIGNGYTEHIAQLKPIPLTETILEKSGFDLEEDYFLDGEARFYRKTIGNGRYFLTVAYYEGHDDFNLHVDDCDKCSVVGGRVQYVHQLQNLLNIYNIELEVNV